MKIPGWSSPADIVESAGGVEGYIREAELGGEVREYCIRLTDMLARVEGATFTIEHYETAKLYLRKIQDSNRKLARTAREFESRDGRKYPIGSVHEGVDAHKD